jgi:hypothetical protein
MSEQEENARIAGLVKEHGQTVERVRVAEKQIGELSSVLSSIGSCMHIERGSITNPGHLSAQLPKLPDSGVSADAIRSMIAEFQDASARLLAIRSQLAPYGLKF